MARDILGNSLNSVVEQARNALMTVGKAGLHVLAPDNFEYYMCSLELIDGYGNTKAFMTFSVMPNNIVETKAEIATITKTNSGITTLFNSSFVPRDISIQGTFGRKLRLLLGMKEVEDIGGTPFFSGNMAFDALGGDVLIKTGYGMTKMLKAMIDKNYQLDEFGKPHILLFKNYSLNTHYVVEPLQSSFNQSVENNMLWYYSIEMKAVAPAEALKVADGKENARFLEKVAAGAIADGIQNLLSDITRHNNINIV